jgi:hypothetical protein
VDAGRGERRGVARGSEAEIVIAPGAEHDLTLPDDSLAPKYERTLVDWLTRHSS